jgi:endonuclease I
LRISNLLPFTFSVGIVKPNPTPEQILVLRKFNAAVSDIPVDGQTYTKGDYIGQSQVAYIGSDTGFKPTFIMANSTYHFAAFSINGPKGYENYLTQNPLRTSVTTPGSNIGNYYAGITSANANLVGSLSAKINPHDTVFYSQYIGTIINNFLTRDTTGGKKVVNCVYTSNPYIYNEPFLWWTGTNSGILTREHTFAQSWMPSNKGGTWPNAANGRELPEFNDLHNLFPADQEIGNVKRSNLPFGEIVGTPTYVSPTGQGKIGLDADGNQVYEPRDAQKGDLARALFYMCIAYNGIGGNNWSLGSVVAANQNQEVLKKWHFQDLPDADEIARHEYIFTLQKNRNPFIDSVNFACHINFSNLSWIAEPGNCGVIIRSLTITSPNGGEVWNVSMPGDGGTVSWVASNIDSVNIQLFVADTLWSNIGTYTASLGSTSVPLSLMVPSTDKAKIKLSNKVDSTIQAISADYFTIDNSVGVMENMLDASLVQLIPNPSKGATLLVLKDIEYSQAIVNVTDLSGRIIQQANGASNVYLNAVKPGIYMVHIQTPKGTVAKKWLVTE